MSPIRKGMPLFGTYSLALFTIVMQSMIGQTDRHKVHPEKKRQSVTELDYTNGTGGIIFHV